MNYNITLENINNIKFDEKYKNIIDDENGINFFSSSGKEHYRLLSYFSTLFNNSNIIDIGSHLGHSALSLSYNKSNTIYSFDILDKVYSNIKKI